MQVVIIADDAVFRTALQAAREIGRAPEGAPGAMYSAMPDEEKSWVERLWGKVEHALNLARLHGRQAAQEAIDSVSLDLAELGETLGHAAAAVRDAVIARVAGFVRMVIQGLLSRVESVVKVGDRDLPIRTVSIEQKVKMSGSLKASLEEICEFVAEGELSLAAEYGVGD